MKSNNFNKCGVEEFLCVLKGKLEIMWQFWSTQTEKMRESVNTLKRTCRAEAERRQVLVEIYRRQHKKKMAVWKLKRELQRKDGNFDKLVRGFQYETVEMNERKVDLCNEISNKKITQLSHIKVAVNSEKEENATEVEAEEHSDSNDYKACDSDDYIIIDDDLNEAEKEEEGKDHEFVIL
jgi:hypothetical protein